MEKEEKEKIDQRFSYAIQNWTKTMSEVDAFTRKHKEGRNAQKLRYFNELCNDISEVKNLKAKLKIINKKFEENRFLLKQAEIKQNEFDILFYQDLNDAILYPEKKEIEDLIAGKEKKAQEIKTKKIKAEKKKTALVKKEEKKNNLDTIPPKVVPTPKKSAKEYNRKFIWSDKKEIENMANFIIDNKFVDEIFRDSLIKLLSTGKTLTPIRWNEKIKVLPTIFFLLLENNKLKCSNAFIAEVLHNNFCLKNSTQEKFSSVKSILSSLKPGLPDKRISPYSDLGKVVFGYFKEVPATGT